MTAPYWLNPDDVDFPSVELALQEPDGLLAVGGDLSVSRLLNAYRHGIFPWYSGDQPILWWSPDPRLVLYPSQVKINRSLAKSLRKNLFNISFDSAFIDVIQACAAPRGEEQGTWITNEMQQAYLRLHEAGYAHSIECWQNDKLVGGLYGIALGKVFFGESMFSRVADASKTALVSLCAHLTKWDFSMIDCQVDTEHLINMGAVSIPRCDFVQQLDRHTDLSVSQEKWSIDESLLKQLVRHGKIILDDKD